VNKVVRWSWTGLAWSQGTVRVDGRSMDGLERVESRFAMQVCSSS